MKTARSRQLLVVVTLLGTACGSTPDCPTVIQPLRPSQAIINPADTDPEIDRLFGDPPITGRLPKQTRWSPDGEYLAFTRHLPAAQGKPRVELWLHQAAGGDEKPLVTDKKLPVGSYHWSSASRIIFDAEGDLYTVDLGGTVRRLTETEAREQSALPSPDNAKVAFVRDHNLFVLEIDSGVEFQLTTTGIARHHFGEVTWIYEEEFGTSAGFGWSKDSKKMWFYRTDETQTPHRTIVEDATGKTRLQAYPRPGETLPLLSVGVVEVPSAGGEAPQPVWIDVSGRFDTYIPRVFWHPEGKQLFVTTLDRLQTTLSLLRCDARSGDCSEVLVERDPRWVNLLGDPLFIHSGRQFLWLSERDGFAHIYQYASDGSPIKRVTQGNWVVRSIDAFDEQTNSVYFTANPQKVIAHEVYRASLNDGTMTPVSAPDGDHRALFSPDASHFLDTHSALSQPPRAELFENSGKRIATVAKQDLQPYQASDVITEIFPVNIDQGLSLMAMLTRPLALEPQKRYPVLVYVYGGPHAQMVRDGFRATHHPWRDLLARRGILVFTIDGRGSAGRGHEFECPIHRRLGEVELQDQLSGVNYLKSLPFVDPGRIGIFGWSYGGTMVLNALLRTGDVFRAGVSVAPVTDWREYDAPYTERYMQRPEDNAEGYEATSLLTVADQLRRPLLLIHGMADNNVHFANAALMVDAFVNSSKQFEVMIYPGKSHGIRGGQARSDVFTRVTRFFEAQL